MGPGDGTQVAGCGGKYLYLLSHLACPYLLFYNNMFLVMSVEDHLTFFMVLRASGILYSLMVPTINAKLRAVKLKYMNSHPKCVYSKNFLGIMHMCAL